MTKYWRNRTQGHWGYFRDDSDLVINSLYLAECLKTGKGALALLAEHCYSCTGGEKSASSSFQPGEKG